jgi:hypothetical protein
VLALVLFVRAGPRPGLAASIGGVLVFAVAGVLLFVLSQWPAIRNMPPDPLVKAVNAGDVKPDTRDMPAERGRMVERGHYLYSVSCAICPAPTAAAARRSAGTIGTLWTRNICASGSGRRRLDRHGLERAIRSGVGRDGRQLHWQGMTWDQLSNMDEEDLRAIVAYRDCCRP